MFILILALVIAGEGISGGEQTPPLPASVRLVPQLGHTGKVTSVAFSHDGRQILTGSEDYTAKLWDTATGAELRTFRGHQSKINCIAFSPDGRRMVTGSWDKTVIIWDTASGEELHTFKGHAFEVSGVAFSPDGLKLLSGSGDGTARLWDAETGTQLHTFTNVDAITAVAFSLDGRLICTASLDFTVQLWDTVSGDRVRTFRGHSSRITGIAVSPDGRQLLTGSLDGTARLWNMTSGECLKKFTGDPVADVAFSPDGKWIIAGGGNHAQLRESKTGDLARTFRDASTRITSVAFSTEGKLLTGNENGTARLWDAVNGVELRGLQGGGAIRAEAAVFSPDGRRLLTGFGNGSAQLQDLAGTTGRRAFQGHAKGITSVAFSPDGEKFLTGSRDTTAKLWDTATGKELQSFIGHSGAITSVAFMPDGKQVVTGSSDKSAKLWNAATGKELQTYFRHSLGVTSLALSPDGRLLLTGSGDQTAKLWDTATGKLRHTFKEQFGGVTSVAFAPDGREILTGCNDRVARLWDLATGKVVRIFRGHSGGVKSVAFSPDGCQVLTGSGDTTARLWNRADARELRSFQGHLNDVACVAFSPDGRTILTGSPDTTIKLWDSENGHLLATLISFTDGIWATAAPDGRFDSNNLEEIKGLNWVLSDDPFTPVPVEAFMRDYYEPELLAKVLNRNELSPVTPLMNKTRLQPEVAVAVEPVMGDPLHVTVMVTARQVIRNGTGSGIADLRLLRDGQLVGYADDDLPLDKDGQFAGTFTVRLPHGESGHTEARFTAYAFNRDRIKSRTSAPVNVKLPLGVPQRKAYLVSIGAGVYAPPQQSLKLTPADAAAYNEILARSLATTGRYAGEQIIPVLLTNNGVWDPLREEWLNVTRDLARRELIKGVFDLLAGRTVSDELRGRIPGAAALSRVTPDDLVIITFSGHGLLADNGSGDFLLTTTDPPSDTTGLKENRIGSATLATWLRDLDAGSMTLIIDACHSAAAVRGNGFKPGPMGSRGLGQLAYDKGVLLLAATQADNIAREYGFLRHGLLTYVLLREGLEARKADTNHDGAIDLREWLNYGVEQVPVVYKAMKKNTFQPISGWMTARSSGLGAGIPDVPQQPALFDFRKVRDEPVLLR
jgi:WD40 repeat protein